MIKYFYFLALIMFFVSFSNCSNKIEEVNELFEKKELEIEYATDVLVIYSDSAKVRLKVKGEVLERYTQRANPRDVFSDGVYVEFLNQNQRPISWLESKFLERYEKTGLVIVRDSVVLYNFDKDKLETSELIFDETADRIYTDKFVRITQPEKGDTSYGYGFETDMDFKEFTIKNNFSAKMNIEDLSKALGQ